MSQSNSLSRRTARSRLRKPLDVVAALRRVPEKRLAVFDLAAVLIGAEGEIDPEAAALREPEVNLAVAEAQAYARATRQAVEALRRLQPR